MTTRPSVGRVGSPARVPGQGAAPLATGCGTNAQPARALAGDGGVQWGNANGTTFRFDPHHTHSRPGLPPASLLARRAAPTPAKRAAPGGPPRVASGRGRAAAVSGFESAHRFSDEIDAYDADDAADARVSMTASGSAGTGSGNQERSGAQDERGGGGGGGGHSDGHSGAHSGHAGPGDERVAVDNARAGNAHRPPAGTASTPENELDMPSLLRRLGSDDASVSLRQRVLAAVLAPAKPQPACDSLSCVRAALIDAVNAGVLIPKVDPKSPDQNCLIPLVLLRALRQMPPSMRAMAQVRAAAMLSMSRRLRSVERVPVSVLAPAPVPAPGLKQAQINGGGAR